MSRKKLKVYIEGDAKSAEKALDGVSSKADKLKSVLGAAFKVGAAAAGAAMLALGAVVKKTADDLARIERISAQTDAAIASTGGVANVTRDEIEGLADSLEKLTSVEAESIQEGQNMLLTFTNIRNGVGEGNDIFNQATETMLNMSVALGQDMSQTAIQLGKALNDPVQGVTALRRVGVQLTEEQEKSIKTFMEQNDIMSAQKIILGELETQFGGSAEALGKTLSGQIEIMKHYMGDFLETAIAPMMPAIGEIVGGFTEMFKGMDTTALEGAFGAIADTVGSLLPAIQSIGQHIFDLMAKVGPPLAEIAGRIGELFVRLVDTLMSSGLVDVLLEIGEILVTAILDVVEALMPVVEALAPIVTRLDQFVADVLRRISPVLTEIATKLADIVASILTQIEPYLDQILDAAMSIIDAILPILPDLLDLLQPILDMLIDLLPPIMQLVEWFTQLASIIVGALGTALEWVVGAIQNFSGVWSAVWDGVRSAFEGVWSAVQWVYDNVIVKIAEALKAVWNGLDAAWDAVWSAAKEIVRGAANAIISIINGLIKGMNTVSGVVDWLIPGVEWGDIPEIPMLAQGGIITRPTIAMLGERGPEAVIPLRSAAAPVAGGDIHVHFHIPGFFGSQRELDDLARRLMADHLPRVSFARGAA